MKDAKLDSVASAVIAILAQCLIAAAIFIGLGFTETALITRALTALTPFLTFPIAFLVRSILEPRRIDSALRDEINLLRSPPHPSRFDDGLYQHGALVGIVTNPREITNDQIEFDAIEESDTLKRREAFFFRDKLLFLNVVVGYAGTQISTTITAEGPRSITRRAVMTGVRCHIIGTASTVARPHD
ncbi:hypothetical protein ABIC65_000955 [Sphingomonas trueperi]|uniref:hypothetical protein n=1 Tax=Sphingomonas trueperi TaxID=53317 RepID=UPI0033967209